MRIDGPPKKWLIVTNLGQSLSQTIGFFLNFEPILRAGIFDKCWLFQTRNPPLSVFLAFWLLYFHNLVQILFERSLFNYNGTLN